MEIWLNVSEVADLAGIARQNVHKRIGSFITRKIPGVGHAGQRLQLLLSSLPEPWQAAYWRRVNALPEPWQEAVLAKALPAPTPPPARDSTLARAGASLTTVSSLPVVGASSSRAVAVATDPNDTTHLKEWQRDCLHARLALLQEFDRRMVLGSGPVLPALIADAAAGRLPPELHAQIARANRSGQALSASTFWRWLAARNQGLIHLAPSAREHGPRVPAWAAPLLKEWQRPQKPSLAWALEQIAVPGALPPGVAPPSPSSAYRFLAKMNVVDRNRGRLGARLLKSLRPYRQRDASGLWPTEVYSMDGHTFDAEVAHPFHGRPFRPEITTVLDISTRRLVGWSVNLAESAVAVLDALRHACQVGGSPALLYVDNGSGYTNHLMSDPAIGFMARLSIEKTHSRAFNSQARGAIERLHQTVWVRTAKTFVTYMGDAMDKETRDRVHKITRKEIQEASARPLLPTWPEFLAAAERAVAEYNARPHSSLPVLRDPLTGAKRHQTPDECWLELVAQNPDCLTPITAADLADGFRPYKTAKVIRGNVRLFNQIYASPDLAGYHGDPVFVGYDLHDPQRVWVRDRNQRLIAVAELNGNQSDYFPLSAVDHAHAKRAKGRADRLERQLEEVHLELAGSRPVIEGRLATPEERATAAEALAELIPVAAPPVAPSSDRPRVFFSDLELYQWVQEHPTLANDQDRAYLAECLQDDDFQALIEREAQKKSRLSSQAA